MMTTYEIIDLCFSSKQAVEKKLLDAYRKKQTDSVSVAEINNTINALEYLLNKFEQKEDDYG